MRNISVVYKLAVAALLAFTVQSCKKRLNGIDNNQIISKPYSLFIADSSGLIEFTNDGNNWTTAFGHSGSQVRAMAYSGNNFIKVLSQDAFVAEGKELMGGDNYNFNPIAPGAFQPSIQAQWQSMILDVPSYGNRVYLAANQGKGVIYSDTNGKRNTWVIDNNFAPNITGTPVITSFTQLADGTLIAYDHSNSRVFYKTGINEKWEEQTPISGLPTGGKFFLSHINNTVVLGDSSGTNGVWYSNNRGLNWQQFTGLPTGAQVICMLAPFERLLLVGTASHGIWRVPLNSSNFQNSSDGLNQTINVRGLTAKSDFYKNNQVVEYVYAATDFGLYRSMDIGHNWILVRRGNYVAAY